MKNDKDLHDRSMSVLIRETDILTKIASLQDEIRKGVLNRDWGNFEDLMAAVNGLNTEFTALEGERERIFAEFSGNGDEKSRFYALVAGFPPELRNSITGAYRKLKFETIKIKMNNDALLGFLNEARTVVAQYLEIAIPDKRGRLYSSRGTKVQPASRNIVLNHRF
jgi:hypothetical protein